MGANKVLAVSSATLAKTAELTNSSLCHLATCFPDVAELRRAASAPRPQRLLLAVAQLAGAVRCELGAAVLASRSVFSRDMPGTELANLVTCGQNRHSLCPRLLLLGQLPCNMSGTGPCLSATFCCQT